MNLFLLGGLAVFALIAVVFLLTAITLRRVVPPNEVHILNTRKKTVSFGKGLEGGNVYYAWPGFLPVIGMTRVILPVSNFDLSLNDYVAYDKDRVPFLVDIVAFFRISDANTAAQRVSSFQELQSQLLAIVQGAVRKVLASHDIDTIMLERSVLGEQFTAEVAAQLKNWGVESVKNVELMNIKDSKDSAVIHNITAKRTSEIERDSRVTVAANHRAAEVAEIEAQREIDLNQQAAQQAVGQRTAESRKAVGIAEQQAQQEVLVQAKETKAREMAVAEVANVREAEITKNVNLVRADEARQTAIITAEGEKQQAVLVAEGKLEAKRREAAGIQAEGEARAEAEKAMQLAPVQAQITLAKEIGENSNYQHYLLSVRRIESDQAIGIAQAEALQDAGIKIIANTGNVGEGIKGITDLFSANGGTQVGAFLEAVAQSDVGKKAVDKLVRTTSE